MALLFFLLGFSVREQTYTSAPEGLQPRKAVTQEEVSPPVRAPAERIELEESTTQPSGLLAELIESRPEASGFEPALGMDDEAAAYWISWELREVPFANARQAIIECLSPGLATHVLVCLQSKMDRGVLPADFLDRPMRKKIRDFLPVGKVDLERALLYGGDLTVGSAEGSFRYVLDRQLRIRRPFPVQTSRLVNPEGKQLGVAQEQLVLELDESLVSEVRELLESTDVFALQLEARSSEIAQGHYVLLPSEVHGYAMGECDYGYYTERAVVDQTITTGGWAARIRIPMGLYPELDEVMQRLWNWQDRRIIELKALVASF